MTQGVFQTGYIDFSIADDYIEMISVCGVYIKKSGNKLLFKCTGGVYCNYLIIRDVYFF